MTHTEQAEIRKVVDNGGWVLVRKSRPDLWAKLQAERKAAQEYVNKVIDIDWDAIT